MRIILTEIPPLFREDVTSPQQLQSNDVVFIHKLCAENQSDVTLNNRWYIGVITHGSLPSLYKDQKQTHRNTYQNQFNDNIQNNENIDENENKETNLDQTLTQMSTPDFDKL